MIRLDADQPDYCRDLDRPNLCLIAQAAIARYLEGDPPSTLRDHDHEARDPASWRRYTIARTRWRLEREAEEQRAEMDRQQREADHVWLYGDPTFRPVTFGAGSWLGEGDAPWDDTFNLDPSNCDD